MSLKKAKESVKTLTFVLFFCFATVLLHAQAYQLEVQDSIRVNYEIYWGQDVLDDFKLCLKCCCR